MLNCLRVFQIHLGKFQIRSRYAASPISNPSFRISPEPPVSSSMKLAYTQPQRSVLSIFMVNSAQLETARHCAPAFCAHGVRADYQQYLHSCKSLGLKNCAKIRCVLFFTFELPITWSAARTSFAGMCLRALYARMVCARIISRSRRCRYLYICRLLGLRICATIPCASFYIFELPIRWSAARTSLARMCLRALFINWLCSS